MTDVQHSPCRKQMANYVRSSGRLQAKYQRRFSMPSRKEELDRVVPDDKTPFKDYNDYKPRKLINNFIKERNSYNNPDRIDLSDECSDDNFIDDGLSSDSATDASSSSLHEGSATSESSSESSTDDKAVADTKRPTSRRTRNPRKVSSRLKPLSRGDQSDSEEELARPLRTHKQRLPADRSSGSDTSSDDNLSACLQRRKRRGRVSVQSDGISDNEDEIQPVESIPEPRAGEEEERNHPEIDTLEGDDKELNLKKDGVGEVKETESVDDSDSDFIATSSSSDGDVISIDSGEGSNQDKPSHEELICIYRQKEWPKKQPRGPQKRRILTPLGSDSSDDDDPHDGKLESQTGDDLARRPHSKRAERLRRKKGDWKTDVLGNYKDKRDKKLSESKARNRQNETDTNPH